MSNKKKEIIVRYAPSPTGPLHIGGVRTALFNYLYAKQNGGKFLLRIEDTDVNRSEKKYEDEIINTFEWLELSIDETSRQSDRKEIYQNYIKLLLEKGSAYISKEKGENESVIRFRNRGEKIIFKDVIRGTISFDTKELGDFVIAKNETSPLYHLAVVIDDSEQRITHVIRGEDGISNTPRQILIARAIQAEPVTYAHIPLILAADRTKLSKRHHTSSMKELIDYGYKKEAVINFLALLGWHPKDDQEIFSLEELTQSFVLEDVSHAGAIFDRTKLNWTNKEYLSQENEEDFKRGILKYAGPKLKSYADAHNESFEKFVSILRERVSVYGDVACMEKDGELDYIVGELVYDKSDLIDPKSQPNFSEIHSDLTYISKTLELINNENFNSETIKKKLWDYASDMGRGRVLWAMRFALSGQKNSPDPFQVAHILGKEESLSRIKKAFNKVS